MTETAPKPHARRRATRLALGALLGAAALAGCAASGKTAIPTNAHPVQDGVGNVEWTARNDGDVWVYDTDTSKMIYTGPVRQGDRVRLDATGDKVIIGGKTVSERPISDEHRYRIYFRR